MNLILILLRNKAPKNADPHLQTEITLSSSENGNKITTHSSFILNECGLMF